MYRDRWAPLAAMQVPNVVILLVSLLIPHTTAREQPLLASTREILVQQ